MRSNENFELVSLSNGVIEKDLEKHKWKGEYARICSNPGINRIPFFASKNEYDAIQNGVTIFSDGDTKLKVNGREALFQISTADLMQVLLIKLTAQNRHNSSPEKVKNLVEVSVDDYIRLRNVPSTKASRDKLVNQLQDDIDILRGSSIAWKTRYKDTVQAHEFNICSGTTKIYGGVKNGTIKFLFNRDLVAELMRNYIMFLPLQILQLDSRNRSLRPVFLKLVEHFCIFKNRQVQAHNIISVRSLLKECANIPDYDTVMETDRAVNRRIIRPFEKILNELQKFFGESYGFCWKYSGAKKSPLTETQEELLAKNDYKTFIELYVVYDIPCISADIESALSEKIKKENEKKIRKRKTKATNAKKTQ